MVCLSSGSKNMVAWMSKNSLLKAGEISETKVAATGIERKTT